MSFGFSKTRTVGPISTSSPRSMKAVSAETRDACCMLWVTMTMVYLSARLLIRSSTWPVAIGSSAEHGSSMRSTSGSTASSRERQSRCCCSGERSKAETAEKVEKALRMAALWDEVKDHLDRPGMRLSGGQQQRLCIARALAVEPEVLLMDEPCSALDPISTAKIEDLIEDLGERLTIVVVTHNMQQAARISDQVAFFLMGELVELGPTSQIFTMPRDQRTNDYVTGRFG